MKKNSLPILLVGVLFAMGLVSYNSFAIQGNKNQDSSKSQEVQEILDRLAKSPEIEIDKDNTLGSPVVIQRATVKEISNTEYELLTASKSAHLKYSTYPSLTIFNPTNKKIVKYAVGIRSFANASNPVTSVLVITSHAIEPFGSRTIKSEAWRALENITVIDEKGQSTSRAQPIPLTSPKTWLPGRSTDLKIAIGAVYFEDGEKWIVSKDLK